MEQQFDQFWREYPRKVGKGAARKAFLKAIRVAPFERILAGLERYKAEISGREMRYVAHPASWLNGERWDDEPGANRQETIYEAPRVDDVTVTWRARLTNYKRGGFWPSNWGPRPEEGNSEIPKPVYDEWRGRVEAA